MNGNGAVADVEKVERVYSNYSGVYDQTFGKFMQNSRELAIRDLAVSPNEQVLEVGVGTGLTLPYYPGHCRVTGIDVSSAMLAKAKQRIENEQLDHISLLRMDAGQMDFPESSFDIVMAAYVVTAVPDYRLVISEMIRVCKPGGRIVMLNHFSNGNKFIAAVEKIISPMCLHMGFRTDLSLSSVLEGTSLLVARKQKMNPFRFWHLVECVNVKNGHNGHSTRIHA